MMDARYPNFWSRLLLGRSFRDQFYIPRPASRFETFAMDLLEKRLIPRELSEIPITRPIFLIGIPRSGTSLLYDLLTAHEDAAYVNHLMVKFPETPLAAEWVRKRLRLDVAGERFLGDSVSITLGGAAEPFTHWARWFGRDAESLYWPPIRRADLGEARVETIRTDIRKVIATYRRERPRFICKFATVQPDILLLQEIFPDAKFVNIVRDGRDVAHSLLKLNALSNRQLERIDHPLLKRIVTYPRMKRLGEYVERFGDQSIECTARIWRDTMDFLEDMKPELRHYHELKYEDLVREPGRVLADLFSFCELSPPRTERFATEAAKIGKTRHRNEYPDAAVVEAICGRLLRRHGYST